MEKIIMEKFRYENDELTFLENSPVPFGIYQFVENKVVTVVLSRGLTDLLGLDPDDAYELMDKNMFRDTHPDDIARIKEATIGFATDKKDYSVVYRSKIKGVYHIIYAQGNHFYSQSGERLAAVWYMDQGVYDSEKDGDIFGNAVNRELRKNIEGMNSSHDTLTGLSVMNVFFEMALAGRDRYIEEGKKPALLFFDLNGMKQYNFQHGFQEGDNLIKDMADLLIKRYGQDHCSRFGGDHFVTYTTEDGLEETLEEIFEEVKELNNGISLSLRVGIYLHSMGDVMTGIACDRAKLACDKNPNKFSSSFNYFSNEMLLETEKQQYIIDNLERAINEQWIQVYYQPLIRSANVKVCDEEALARWIDPVKGFMSPADFIPILEESRLIYKLDLYVTDQILLKMKKIKEAGLYVVPCSVNISRSDFGCCDIVEEIRRRVETAGMDPSLLTIEITESIIGSDVEYMKHQVERFHEYGFKVWMDDYGSGYSSPDILQKIPFDTIKLDMQFMRQFDKGEKSRIIINGLIKMAIGLGMETVAEGVENEEQAEFLREAGCTKLQGYYYCKPIPLDTVLERYDKGEQIGFENPEESEYYASIGRVNLFDLSISGSEDENLQDYFNTMPMAVLEMHDDELSVIRSNRSFRELLEHLFKVTDVYTTIKTEGYEEGPGSAFLKALFLCGEDGGQMIIDETTKDGKNIHVLIRKISENPVFPFIAFQIAVLEIREEKPDLSYAYVAQALSSDYLYLYYVDLETENFIEYRPNTASGDMFIERHGENFFAASRADALKFLHKGDRDAFVESFNRENVLRSIDENGTFTFTYRLLIDEEPFYVNMKAVRIGTEGDHIIIGVNNVDAQMKQQEVLERLKEERITFSRINALSGNYISFYTVNPYNDHYFEFSANSDYETLGVSKEGDDFFKDALRQAKGVIHPDDVEAFEKNFTKENVFKKIQEGDVFITKYRLMINDTPLPVRLKAALVNENGRQQLIIGISENL